MDPGSASGDFDMLRAMRTALFALFACSGFCGLVYELVWLRLSLSAFGATASVTALFLSLFMAGLGAGAWAGGRLAGRGSAARGLRLYAACELLAAVGALAVPAVFALGHGADALLARAAWLAAALLPFSAAMGATLPLGVGAVRAMKDPDARSFSRLYLANAAGAAAGSFVCALVLIETFGFRGTLAAAAALGTATAAAAFALSLRASKVPAPAPTTHKTAAGAAGLLPLFAVGCAGMGLELLWTRQFGVYLGNDVYSLGSILAFYLLATAAGAALYRRRAALAEGDAWSWLAAAAMLPLLACDERMLPVGGLVAAEARLVLGIFPVCALMGYLTPALVDDYCAGVPERAGVAYAVNAAGCVLGPLLAGFVLRPWLGARATTAFLAAPFLVLGARRGVPSRALAAAAVYAALFYGTAELWTLWPEVMVRRDPTATVVAGLSASGRKQLLVNGNAMTILTPVTKMMAHLPLAFLPRPPRRAVAICFGMGTTFRSLTSWGVEATAVELVPSVPEFFSYFHPDAAKSLATPGARIVIDDGRRFLERSDETFDLITLDPPPPPEAPGNSLLYSRQFYALAKRRLSPGGILQQWHMGGDPAVTAAMARALAESFRFVRVFPSVEGWGFHFLASDAPIPARSPAELARRLPSAARADLLEWGPEKTAEAQFARMVAAERPVASLYEGRFEPALDDDRPLNEYFLLRRAGLLATYTR